MTRVICHQENLLFGYLALTIVIIFKTLDLQSFVFLFWVSSSCLQVEGLWLYTASEVDGVIKDPCKGDSGGPLIIDNGGQPLLVGVLEVVLKHTDDKQLCRSENACFVNTVGFSCSHFPQRAKATTAAQTDQVEMDSGATLFLRETGCSGTYLTIS